MTHTKYIFTKGFTLLEVIIAIFIFTVISGGVAAFSAYYFNNYSFSFIQFQNTSQAEYGLQKMIREIREARSGEDGSWPLVQTDDNTIIFYSDVDYDGKTERVRYYLNGTQLMKGVIQPTGTPVTYPPANETLSTIAYKVDTNGHALFTYYNGGWPTDTTNNPLTAANRLLNTRLINVYIRINQQNARGPQPFDMNANVQIRSMKDNL
jgi:prepilin-type N-terminal cleavage/methylation domain-containing protein